MKKSTLGIIAVVVLVGGGGGGCIIHQYLQTPPAAKQSPAPSPVPTPAPEPAPAAATTMRVDENDNGTVLNVTKGAEIDLVLNSTYWEIQPTEGDVLRPLTAEPVVKGALSNPPGMGTGTVEMRYRVMADGTAVITASRTTCGEAMLCTGTQGRYSVTVTTDGSAAPGASMSPPDAVPPAEPSAGLAPEPAPTPTPTVVPEAPPTDAPAAPDQGSAGGSTGDGTTRP